MTFTTPNHSAPAPLPVPAGKTTLLKTDVLGRVRTTRERRQMILDEFDQSGASAVQFARLIGVKYSTFAQWVQQRRRELAAEPKSGRARGRSPLRLIEAIADHQGAVPFPSGAGVLLHLSRGVRVELTSPAQVPLVAALLQALSPRTGSC